MSNKAGLLKASFISCAIALAVAPTTQADSQGNQGGERYIIQFKDGRGAAGRGALNRAGAQTALELNRHNAVAAHIPAAALNGLSNNPNIEYIEEDAKRFPFNAEKEPNGVPYGIEMVGALGVAEVNNGSKTVCIIDSGIDLSHTECAAQANIDGTSDSGTGDWFSDENYHGTHVAGTVAAMANNEGVIGVNSNGTLNLHIIKVFNADGWGYSSGLVAALDECEAAGSDIVSMSLGGSVKSRTEDRAFKASDGRGVLSIAAAGNDGNTRHSYPASYNSVVSVAAVDANKQHAAFSQRTSQVELAAPGVSVLSSVPMGGGQNRT